MSPREKKLLTLFAVAGFVMVNLVGLSAYKKRVVDISSRRLVAERDIEMLAMIQANREQRLDEMQWLQKHMPEPAEYENVQTALQTFCAAEAKRFGLQIAELPSRKQEDLKGEHFHRVQVVYRVNGMEEQLYRWLDRINMPTELRANTKLVIEPNDQDKTRVDCIATIEQWFVPVGPSA